MTFAEWLKKASEIRWKDEVALMRELVLNDGTELSVQASSFHMCSPKEKLYDGDYTSVEVYTHGRVIAGLDSYYMVSPSIYGYVPIDVMETVCKLHLGINERCLYGKSK